MEANVLCKFRRVDKSIIFKKNDKWENCEKNYKIWIFRHVPMLLLVFSTLAMQAVNKEIGL